MIAYTIAAISFLSNKGLDLGKIWSEQFVVSPSTLKEMSIDLPNVYAKLTNGAEHISYKVKETYTGSDGKRHSHFVPRNLPSEDIQKLKNTVLFKVMIFVKKIEPFIWDHLVVSVDEGLNINEWTKRPRCWEALRVKLDEKSSDYALPKEILSNTGDEDEEITDGQKRKINEVSDISAEEWWSINKWAKETYKLTPRETAFIGQMGYRIKRGFDISYKQARWAMDLYEKAKANGWTYEK